MTNDSRPYGSAAVRYWEAGWRGVLPLPADAKTYPPRGYTGHDGRWPSRADVQAWADGPEGVGNIALRLPADVIGIDVDAYGEKAGAATLAERVAVWGPLPDTWVSSARGDGVSGVRLYRIPAGSNGETVGSWPGEVGPGVELCHLGHRYVVVAPSTHPEGMTYRWTVPERDRGAGTGVPRPERLPDLPRAWYEGLWRPAERRAAADLDEGEARAWLDRERAGEPCVIVEQVAFHAVGALAAGKASRHEVTRDAVHALARFVGEGHAGGRAALRTVRDGFLAAVRADRGRDGPGEWVRLLLGAVKLAAAAAPEPVAACGCEVWEGAGLGFDPGFPGDGGASGEGLGGGRSEAFGDGSETEPQVSGGAGRDPVDQLEAALLSAAEVEALPPPEPLVEGLLYRDTLAWLIGKPGSFKSFVALTIAGHVGRGLAWAGRGVRRGDVIYVAAEGAGGLGQRVRAWRKHYGEMTGASFLCHAVQARGDWWGPLCALAARRRPALIVLDTQARVSVGFKENDNSDMGEFIMKLDQLRRAAGGACVLVLHHIGRAGDDARGASAIDGAQDTELKMTRVGGEKSLVAKLVIDKQKDGSDVGEVLLAMVPVDLGADETTGVEVSSLVAMPPAFGVPAAKPWRDDLPTNQQRIVDVLAEHAGMLGGTRAEIRALAVERFGPMPGSSYSTAFTKLAEIGVICRIEGTQRWRLSAAAEQPEGFDMESFLRVVDGGPAGGNLIVNVADSEQS